MGRFSKRLDADDVRAALTRELVVQHVNLEVRGRPDGWWRGRKCPACGKAWRDLAGSGFCIGTRGWTCKACTASGDLLDLLARLTGLEPRRDFRRVLALGAQLAGVSAADHDGTQARRRRDHTARDAARRRHEANDAHARRRDARRRAGQLWPRLQVDHPAGRAYLGHRGLDVDALIARGLIRFYSTGWRVGDATGDPAVALHDGDGELLNVVRRRIGLDEPRTPGLRAAPTDGTLVGRLDQIQARVDVVITEGIVDTLTAALAWPASVVLGAHGAAQLSCVVAAAAPRVRGWGGRLVLVPDPDPAGQDAAVRAAEHALRAGMSMRRDLDVLELGGHDLNEAWRAGWRP
ncbi:MAG: toprim domain-containing protein [Kofleriaceae bacterium]|nr:toprim domain-containing protein [Kofleriaceae bacterium]